MPTPANIHEADFIRNHPEGVPRDPMFTVLRAYCLGLLKSCWYVTERIKFEHYYEVSLEDYENRKAQGTNFLTFYRRRISSQTHTIDHS